MTTTSPTRRVLPFVALALLLGGGVRADDDSDSDSDSDGRRRRSRVERAAPVVPPSAELTRYREECGACHLAYPPGLLPRRSWEALLGGLHDHFGDNAELDEETRRSLSVWLGRYAQESGSHALSSRVLRRNREPVPLRITTLPYVEAQHDEIVRSVWKRPTVRSRASCAACHRGAEEWDFDEDRVRIPKP